LSARSSLRLAACLLPAMLCLLPSLSLPAQAAEWKDSDCRPQKDDGGNRVQVCRDGESIGIFWEDDSYVNGWCDGRAYEIEYKGLSKSDAISWIRYYCG